MEYYSLTLLVKKYIQGNTPVTEVITMGKLGNTSLVCAILSLFIFPPLFGLAGFIIGIIGMIKEDESTAVIGFILSIIFPLIGMFLGILAIMG